MAFPASNQALSDAYRTLKNLANGVRNQAANLRAQSLAGPVSADKILNYLTLLNSSRTQMAALSATPGLATYAQAQENNPALNIVAEYTAMVAQVDATITWIVANFPQDVNGFKLAFTLAADGSTTYRTFDTATLATLRTALDALTATIS
jgi:hypothetical protein